MWSGVFRRRHSSSSNSSSGRVGVGGVRSVVVDVVILAVGWRRVSLEEAVHGGVGGGGGGGDQRGIQKHRNDWERRFASFHKNKF